MSVRVGTGTYPVTYELSGPGKVFRFIMKIVAVLAISYSIYAIADAYSPTVGSVLQVAAIVLTVLIPSAYMLPRTPQEEMIERIYVNAALKVGVYL